MNRAVAFCLFKKNPLTHYADVLVNVNERRSVEWVSRPRARDQWAPEASVLRDH